jgi:hypothetical protein
MFMLQQSIKLMIWTATRNLERLFDKFPKYHIKILFGDYSAKVGKEDIFKPTTGNDS